MNLADQATLHHTIPHQTARLFFFYSSKVGAPSALLYEILLAPSGLQIIMPPWL